VKFKPQTTEAQRTEWKNGLVRLKKTIPSVKEVNTGKKIPGRMDQGWDDGVVMLFDDLEGLRAYLPHADHQAFLAKSAEIIADATIFDMETTTSGEKIKTQVHPASQMNLAPISAPLSTAHLATLLCIIGIICIPFIDPSNVLAYLSPLASRLRTDFV